MVEITAEHVNVRTLTPETQPEDSILSLEHSESRIWSKMKEFKNNNELTDFLYSYTHKMTQSHGRQTSKCNQHIDSTHKMFYAILFLFFSQMLQTSSTGKFCRFL